MFVVLTFWVIIRQTSKCKHSFGNYMHSNVPSLCLNDQVRISTIFAIQYRNVPEMSNLLPYHRRRVVVLSHQGMMAMMMAQPEWG